MSKKPAAQDLETWSAEFKALSHPERLLIFRTIYLAKDQNLTVSTIAALTNISQPVVSRQLNLLKAANLLYRKPVSNSVRYYLNDVNKHALKVAEMIG